MDFRSSDDTLAFNVEILNHSVRCPKYYYAIIISNTANLANRSDFRVVLEKVQSLLLLYTQEPNDTLRHIDHCDVILLGFAHSQH